MNEQHKVKLAKTIGVMVVVLTVFLIAKAIGAFQDLNKVPSANAPAISVSGVGNIYAVPDIAQITYTVRADAASASAASTAEAAVSKAAIAAVEAQGVASADIQTQNYNSAPQYSTTTVSSGIASPTYCIAGEPCPIQPPQPTKQVITGYEVSETVAVKVRNTDNAANVIGALNKAGVKEVSGPDFTIDNPEALQNQAQQKAIADAQAQATTLAQQLGVHLGKIVSFTTNNGGPIYYAKAMSASAPGATPAPTTPDLSTGQQEITSNVTITYAIR